MITDKSKFIILLAKVINVFIYKNDEHDLIITNYELRMHLNTDNTGLFIKQRLLSYLIPPQPLCAFAPLREKE